MRLLVSVATPTDAAAAVAGGADIIDAKNPAAGPLGAVTMDVLRQIDAAARAHRPVTAALGDAAHEADTEQAAFAFAAAGARLVKVGFAGVADSARALLLLRAAVRGANAGGGGCGVVAVAYADGAQVGSPDYVHVIDTAAAAGAAGVLLDTAEKNGPGLRALMTGDAVSSWVERTHRHGLTVALAGRLQIEDLRFVRDAGADVAGVRGAACEGGRAGYVDVERVRALRRACYQP